MRIFCDTANLSEIEEWDSHPWVSGFTTNPTLMRGVSGTVNNGMEWAREAVRRTRKPISIDGPPAVWDLGPNVWRKMTTAGIALGGQRVNWTAVCHANQLAHFRAGPNDIVSVFAGRIMDTGRYPTQVIAAAKETGARVLWASCREPYNIVQAEQAGCDIITVPPAILKKWLGWRGKPLDVVAEETIAQFEHDSVGLW